MGYLKTNDSHFWSDGDLRPSNHDYGEVKVLRPMLLNFFASLATIRKAL
jgi:hypothetical protein